MEVSSPGRVQPKIKSIDVEANLLAERIAERERLLEALTRKALAALGVLIFALLVLPLVYRMQARVAGAAHAAALIEADVAKKLAARKAVLNAMLPKVEGTALVERVHSDSFSVLSLLSGFVDASNDRMVLSSLRGEVVGGDVKTVARADAESYSAAREFVDAIGRLPGTKSAVLKQWRQNEEFGAGAVNFEVEHVGQVRR